jgi:hypothetical protein
VTAHVQAIDASKECFKRDLKALPRDVKEAARERFLLLLDDPPPGKLRLHYLKDHKVWKIDLSSGKGARYQAVFELDNGVATFLRAGSHKFMDRLY